MRGTEDGGSDNEMPFLNRHSFKLGHAPTRKNLPTDGEKPEAEDTVEGDST